MLRLSVAPGFLLLPFLHYPLPLAGIDLHRIARPADLYSTCGPPLSGLFCDLQKGAGSSSTASTSPCSGQLIPDTVLSFSSVFAGANPSLN